MSSASGIKPTPELISTFSACLTESSVRALQVRLEGESLVCTDKLAAKGNWEQDFDALKPWLSVTLPSVILYRKDTKTTTTNSSSSSFEWVFIQYVPEKATVRDKMLYASSKVGLSKELGDSNFSEYIYAIDPSEVSFKGYQEHVRHVNADAPLTAKERELQEVKQSESNVDISVSSRRANAPGVYFPLTKTAESEIQKLKSKQTSFVVLSIALQDENIVSESSGKTSSVSELATKIPSNVPRFILGSHENEYYFVYICPPSFQVKERMMYSSSKASLLNQIQDILGVSVEKKAEIDFPNELTETLFVNEKPVASVSTPKFSRPTRPGRK